MRRPVNVPGPVVVATPFDDFEEVVALANDTNYGLGAGIFTSSLDKAHTLASRLCAGNVWINCYGVTHPTMPFGGYKESGIGREMGDADRVPEHACQSREAVAGPRGDRPAQQ